MEKTIIKRTINETQYAAYLDNEKPVNKGFVKLWTNQRNKRENLKSLDIDLFFYLIYRADSRNRGLINLKDLARMYKTSYQRVSRHLDILEKSNLLKKTRTGYYMLNPDYIFKGMAADRAELLIKYNNCIFEWKTAGSKL